MQKPTKFWRACAAGLLVAAFAAPAYAFSTMVMAQAQSCDGIASMTDGAVGQPEAAATAQSAGQCMDGSSSSAAASATASIAAGSIAVAGDGSGFQEFTGAATQASFSERLTIENVPAALPSIDLRVVIEFVGTPPAPAFYNSASMDGYANPQVFPGDVRLRGCSGDLCPGNVGPVRSETLDQTITLNRNGLGEVGYIEVYRDARSATASTATSIAGSITVEVVGVPDAVIVSESGVFGTGNQDSDGDGVPDASDNCTLAANAAQRDTDGDGIGNACDADLNNDCVVNSQDLGLLSAVFFSADPDADFNGDGVVNAGDLGLMKQQFFGAPGPSEVALVCPP